MGISERKERDRNEMKKCILDAALQLFTEKGYESVTLRLIAQKIEYSPATIYLYFKDKDDIFYELHTAGFEKLYKIQSSLASIADPVERLHKHSEIYIKFALENPQYYDIMFIMRSLSERIKAKKEWKAGERSYQVLRENVQSCFDAGYFKGQHVEVVTFSMWSFVHGIASLIIRGRHLMIPKEYLEKILEGSRKFIYDIAVLSKGS
jgi:AcrR family transcriptional regulator